MATSDAWPRWHELPKRRRFSRITTDEVFEIEHLNAPHFFLTLTLVPKRDGTEVHWRQTFDSVADYEKIAQFVAEANEQNLERLAAEVQRGNSAG